MHNTVFPHETYQVKEEHVGGSYASSSEEQGFKYARKFKFLTYFFHFDEVDKPYTVQTTSDVL
jgi:hypothetical protein